MRNRDYVCWPGQEQWFASKSLYRLASRQAKALGDIWMTRNVPFLTRFYLVRNKVKGRRRTTVAGERQRNAYGLKMAQRESEPWLLASNLPAVRNAAKRVVAIYAQRMQVEQGFRGLKALRHGFAFRHNLGDDPMPVANLLLIAAIGVFATWLTGLAGITKQLHRRLQANTERRRRVLSIFFVGSRLMEENQRFTQADYRAALDEPRNALESKELVLT